MLSYIAPTAIGRRKQWKGMTPASSGHYYCRCSDVGERAVAGIRPLR